MRSAKVFPFSRAILAGGVTLTVMAGCATLLGIEDVTERPGAGGSGGGTSPSSSSTGSPSSSSTGPVCDPTTRWPIMSAATIVPPSQWAGLHLQGPDDAGITIDEATAINCAGADAGSGYPSGGGVTWGDAGQVTFYYDLTTGRQEETNVGPGYEGSVTWHSADSHTYVAQIGKQITKDGEPFTIDWQPNADAGITQATLDAELTELYNGLVLTFGNGESPRRPTAAPT